MKFADMHCHGVRAFQETNIRRKYRRLTLAQVSQTTGHSSVYMTSAAASLSRSLLLFCHERDWATVLDVSCRADCRPSQWRLRNHVSPRRLPVEDAQTHASDMDSAAVRLIECTFMRDYYRLNSEYQKNEFKFEFLKQTSNFPTLFNIFCLHSSSDNWQRMITMHCL